MKATYFSFSAWMCNRFTFTRLYSNASFGLSSQATSRTRAGCVITLLSWTSCIVSFYSFDFISQEKMYVSIWDTWSLSMTEEWIYFSLSWKEIYGITNLPVHSKRHCCCLVSKSCLTLFVALWTVAHQGSSVHGSFQARILEWVVISSSRGSSQPRGWTHVSWIDRRIVYHWAI